MEVTFVSPYEDITAYPVRLLSAVLREKGYTTRIIFIPKMIETGSAKIINPDCIDAVARISRYSDLIGFSFFSCHLSGVKQLTQSLKQRGSCPIIWGGKHISAQPFDAIGLADYVAIGEAEESLSLLLERISDGSTAGAGPGIWVPRERDIGKDTRDLTDLPPLVQNLDTLPFPDYSLENHYIWTQDTMHEMDADILRDCWILKNSITGVTYQTMGSRGCPHSCSYCSSYKSFYKKQRYLRFRSSENIIAELKEMKQGPLNVEDMLLSDDNFFAQRQSVIEEFCKSYKEEVNLPLRCLCHPETVTRGKIRSMVEAGMNQIQIGIQTGSPRIQKLYNRKTPPAKILAAVNILNEFKNRLVPFYDFITDNPFETRQDTIETLKLIIEFPRPYVLNVFSLLFLPGTKLYELALKDGMPIDSEKEWVAFKKTYLNFIFLIVKLPLPKWMLRLMVSKPVVMVMDNPSAGRLLHGVPVAVKKVLSFIR